MRVLAPMLVLMLATPAMAAGDAERGADVARQWCVECHATEITDTGTDQAPAWRAIAADPAKDDAALRAFLQAPHPAMRNIPLTGQDIEDIITYIRTLTSE